MGSLVVAAGCAPADVAGNYSVNLTNGENGCGLDNWTVGESTANIPIVVTQSDDTVQLDVQGLGGTYLDVVLGSSLFNGNVSGNGISAALIGSNAGRQGGCTYTTTVDLDATVDGDFIEGELQWRPVTNGHADCGILETCRNYQSFNGTRPPSE
ncbi:MAG: hypothetical protein H6719_10285 [Sandaracinaceae bacterium]|nr:hypothetical protein [Sandaracinaceae bacterium]